MQLDKHGTKDIEEFTQEVLVGLEREWEGLGKSFEFLPKCLEIIASIYSPPFSFFRIPSFLLPFPFRSHFSNLYKATKPEEKTDIIKQLTSTKWPPSSVVNLATTFRDISMTNSELERVVKKIVRYFNFLHFLNLRIF